MSLSFLLGCPCTKSFDVTTDTLSPLAKCGVVDGFVRACVSSLCSCNTERTMVCTSCNNRNRSVASRETGMDGRMLNNKSGGSSRENPKLASNGVCSIPSAREALYANSTVVVESSNLSRHNRKTTKKLLNCDVHSLCQSICLRVSTGRHVQARSEASSKCLPEATDEFRVAITDQHTG
jgi:hypothetical protein